MARSSYVYVVSENVRKQVVMAFTVRKELVRWLEGRAKNNLHLLTVHRLGDGDVDRTVIKMSISELLGG